MQINALNTWLLPKRIIEVHRTPTGHRKAGVNAQPSQAGGQEIGNFHLANSNMIPSSLCNIASVSPG